MSPPKEKDIIIKIQNTVYGKIFKGKDLLKTLLSYKAQIYMPGQFRGIRKEYRKSAITRSGLFYIGHLQEIKKYCKKKGHSLQIIKEELKLPELLHKQPRLNGITLRPDQLKAVKAVFKKKRGQIIAPTGTGKTVVAGAILSAYYKCKALFLAHTKDLVTQTCEEFEKFGLGPIGKATGEGTKDFSQRITVATMQTFVKFIKKYGHRYDIIIVDEGHRISDEKGTYGKILSICPAPIKLCFTATPQSIPKALIAARGLIGPKIAELTWEEGAELNILAVPKLKIVKIPVNPNIKDIRKFSDIYYEGIIHNNTRNKIIFNLVKEFNQQEKSVLILVTMTEHGKVLSELGEKLLKKKIPFIYGNTSSEKRGQVKTKLKDKKLLSVIASTIWKEGINIPSLDVIVNACGGKGEIAVLQSIGRGLRRTKTKDTVIIVDFFDASNVALIDHFGHRLCLYFSKKWL